MRIPAGRREPGVGSEVTGEGVPDGGRPMCGRVSLTRGIRRFCPPERGWWPGCALLVPLVLALGCAPPAADLVLLNGRVFTADPARPWAEALAIRGDRIVAVGTSAETAALASEGTSTRDLDGRTVIPGLDDAHVVDPGGEAPELVPFSRAALASGVTSMQWFVGARPVKDAAQALVDADLPIRFRVFRMPRLGADGETIDSRPHLPPQPTLRVDVRGMGFRLAGVDEARIRQAVGWAYATEDLLAIEPADADALGHYLRAVETTGLAEIWRRKRPRVERPGADGAAIASRLAASGMVAVVWPDGNVPLASLVKAGVTLALATGHGGRPFDAVAWAVSTDRGAEALTVEQAITAFTRGAAHAELADRDKGRLSVGALADLAVLSADPFTVPRGEISGTRSVLTIIGGRVVHDVP